MPSSSVPPALVATCAAIALAAVLADTPGAAHARAADQLPAATADAGYAAEAARIQVRFDSVLRELRAVDVTGLSPSRRTARAARIATLQAYRDRGEFPHNHDFRDAATPYFVDHRGVVCAVGYLLEQSGRRDIVDRVRDADNNVWVAELAGDTAFTRWLDRSGLTLAEAARIQVPYDMVGNEEVEETPRNRLNTAAALVSSGLGLASITWNATADGSRHRRLRAALGFTAGAAGLAVAATRVEARGAPLAVGISSGTIGLVSAAMATRALFAGRQPSPVAMPSPAAPEQVTVSVAPTVVVSGERMAPGFSMHVRF